MLLSLYIVCVCVRVRVCVCACVCVILSKKIAFIYIYIVCINQYKIKTCTNCILSGQVYMYIIYYIYQHPSYAQ